MRPMDFLGKMLFPVAIAATAITVALALKIIYDLEEVKKRIGL